MPFIFPGAITKNLIDFIFPGVYKDSIAFIFPGGRLLGTGCLSFFPVRDIVFGLFFLGKKFLVIGKNSYNLG